MRSIDIYRKKITLAAESVNNGSSVFEAARIWDVSERDLQARLDYYDSEEYREVEQAQREVD